MRYGPIEIRQMTKSCPPPFGILKFNLDGAARGNPGPAGIGVLFAIVEDKFYVCSLTMWVSWNLMRWRFWLFVKLSRFFFVLFMAS